MTALLLILGLLVGPIVLAEVAVEVANRIWSRRGDDYAEMPSYAERTRRATPTRTDR